MAEMCFQFTSHYVSINSHQINSYHTSQIYLHPTMYLLIRFYLFDVCSYFTDLHPTMYLLIPSPVTTGLYFDSNLHPTMYLLIPLLRLF